jgi:hypothetical protein
LTTRLPCTFSCSIAFRRAAASCWRRLFWRCCLENTRSGMAAIGKTAIASKASTQSMTKAATTSPMSVVVSWKIERTASVTEPRTRVTSAVTRDTIWPARWRLKNARSRRCRWAVTSLRRSVTMRWPIQSFR